MSVKGPEAADPAAEPTGSTRKRPRDRRVLAALVGSAVLTVVAAFLAGAALGWGANARAMAGRDLGAADPTASGIDVAADLTATVLTPDVRGLSENDARQVLADAGVATGAVTTTTREAAGPAGRVIAQDPVFGTADPATVFLTVSTTAKVPDVAGKDGQAIAAALAQLGAEVTLRRTYLAGTPAGVGISIEPAPGTDLPAQVTLVLADGATSLYLTDLDTVTGGCSDGRESVNGVQLDNTLTCPARASASETSWIIGHAIDTLDATLGIPDDVDPSARVRVEVLADGVPKADLTVTYGTSTPLHVDTTGALRLTVRISNLTPAEQRIDAAVAIADAKVSGGTDAVTAWNTPAP